MDLSMVRSCSVIVIPENDALTNLSIAWQEDETGRLTVQTIVGSSWTHRGYHGYPDPAVSHWSERCLGHVWSDPEPWGNTLKGG